MSDTIIRVENLGKKYKLGYQKQARYTTLREQVTQGAKRLLKTTNAWANSGLNPSEVEEFWALQQVSFEIKRGDRVGIIGRNGAGKSTLLKILSRITDPTIGRVSIRGRVASLLEVGTGFHPELTGRENIYLNGAILGMSKAEIKKKFDEIVAFAEVEKFLDTPVKRYSSGMYVRLAFAVAAHLEPEILIVDEVLAVGDVQFQKKCLGKMEDVAEKEGRTVLFVSHNIGMIRSLCHRCILLSKGQMIRDEGVDAALNFYLSNYQSVAAQQENSVGEVTWDVDEDAPGGSEIRLKAIRLLSFRDEVKDTFEAARSISIELSYKVFQPLSGMRFVIQLINHEGVVAFASTDHYQRQAITAPGLYKTVCQIPGELLNLGRYTVRVNAGIPGVKVLIPGQEFISFLIVGAGNHGSNFPENWPGVVAPKLEWQTVAIEPLVSHYHEGML